MLIKFSTIRNLITNHTILYATNVQKFLRNFYSEQHQLTSITTTDRYPELFNEAKRYCGIFYHSEKLSILSFGCSTGEECISLKKYFAEARIVGVDINKYNLLEAKKRNAASGISYFISSPENIAKEGKYDLIFCLSVLCRLEDTKDVDTCEKIYPFSKFEKTISMLTNQLNEGGMIILFNSNFRFEDTQVFQKGNFEILLTPSIYDSGFVHKFNSENKRVAEAHKHCLYRMRLK